MITIITVYDICLHCIFAFIIVPLSCVGLLTFCLKACYLNIPQQWVFDVIDTSSLKSPTIHVGTC